MPSLFLSYLCETEVAISAKSGTIGGHESLSYLPGGTLLGAAARRLYDRLGPDRSFATFHSGAVRFGCAYPAGTLGAPALPVPLSLHHRSKEAAAGFGNSRLSKDLVNLARDLRSSNVQPQQLRGTFHDATGQRVKIEVAMTLRTAVDPGTGRARNGLLYGLSAMRAGTRLLGRIDADNDTMLEDVRSALVGKTLFLGRSRNAEVGRVACTEAAPWTDPTPATENADGSVLLWCLSDLWLRDPGTGQPTLTPFPKAFGLPGTYALDADRSFVRTRRYSPFHGKRMRPDLERQVIDAGSVLVFRPSSTTLPALDRAALRQRLMQGVGEARQEGLGQVALDPNLLAGPVPRLEAAPALNSDPAGGFEAPSGALATWLAAQHESDAAEREAWRTGRDLSNDALKRANAKKIKPAGWGEIRRIAREQRLGGKLVTELEKFTTLGVRKRLWDKDGSMGNPSLGRWIVEQAVKFSNSPGPEFAARVIESMAHEAARQAREDGKKKRQGQGASGEGQA